MTTLTSVRTELRTELKDTDATAYRWTNDELDRHIGRAVTEYSRAAPREMKTSVATVSGSRDIDITGITGYADLVKVLAVEYPKDKFPRRYQRFSYWNGVITLLGDEVPDGSSANVYWGRVHVLADVGSPTCTIQEKDLETVMTGSAGYAAVAWATYATNRVNLGGDTTPREFLRWGNDRLRQFQKELRLLKSKLRATRMYAPFTPAQSETTDWGP